jgi:sigma-B regulation protein RsbU (phosphoserine phosphatase)
MAEGSRRAGRGAALRELAIPLLVLAVLVVVDALMPLSSQITGSFSLAAVLGALRSGPVRTAAVAVLATVLAALAGSWDGNAGTQGWALRLIVCAVISTAAVVIAADRERREQRLRRLTVVADAAQRAVLRAMPTSVGRIALAARYLSAADDALIGGDLYEVSATPFGVRIIVGDVRGKGLDAVQLAAAVVGAFRQAALTVTDLAAVAVALDEVVHAVSGDEDFVTAVLAEFHDDGTVAFVNCGHHAPLQIDPDEAVLLDVGEHAPPLGLGVAPELTPHKAHWKVGSRLLFYTDGLVEARDVEGGFFVVQDQSDALRAGTLDEALDAVVTRVRRHVADGLHDDLALVLAERRP